VLADPVFERTDSRVNVAAEQAALPAAFSAIRDSVSPGANDIPRLLASRKEAEEIMAVTPSGEGFVATDFDAGRTITSTGVLGQYRIVQFATHGVVNTQHPELSGSILSVVDRDGESVDGFLQLHDIYNLDLSQTQLVVLSACRTALGKEVKGEGLMGLTRGFMYAGSKSVIASLWKVDDRATAELMKHFYHAMFDEGLPPSAALRKAKETMWRQPRWRAPYFWAAFVLQGEYQDGIIVQRKGHTWTYFIIAFGVISLLAIGYFAERALRSRSDAPSTTTRR
jgi:CHAT domain-containing protein